MVIKKKQTGSNRFLMKNDSLKGQHRINEQIRAKEVRIVGDEEIEAKVYPIFQALKMAEEREMDLVEISPNAEPPVCRIIDNIYHPATAYYISNSPFIANKCASPAL